MTVTVIVETFRNPGEPSNANIRVRPVDSRFPSTMRVQCSRSLRNRFPPRTRFKLPVEVVHRGAARFLRVVGNPPWIPLTSEARHDKAVVPSRKSPARPLKAMTPILEQAVLEGAQITHTMTRFERDPKARLQCIQCHGLVCTVCGFDFQAVYGRLGLGFIQVHHLRPLSEIRGRHEVNPSADLRPVCANCHAMLHKRVPALEIAELRRVVMRRRNKPAST